MLEKQRQHVQKVLHDADMLKEAKAILREHQHNREICKKKLLVSHYRVLLQDAGASEKLKRKDDEGRMVNARRPELITAYWEIHKDLPTGGKPTLATTALTHTLTHNIHTIH